MLKQIKEAFEGYDIVDLIGDALLIAVGGFAIWGMFVLAYALGG